jgi:hypothetical protein
MVVKICEPDVSITLLALISQCARPEREKQRMAESMQKPARQAISDRVARETSMGGRDRIASWRLKEYKGRISADFSSVNC